MAPTLTGRLPKHAPDRGQQAECRQ